MADDVQPQGAELELLTARMASGDIGIEVEVAVGRFAARRDDG